MYVDTSTIKGKNKTYTRHLLRRSFRENGKVKHETVANLSQCSEDEIAAIKFALKHKKNIASLVSLEDIETTMGKHIGAVWALKVVAERVGVAKALGNKDAAKLALLQVIARAVTQGSRLSAVRFAQRHAVCEILGIKQLDEEDLYENLGWLAKHQEAIEQRLFKQRFAGAAPSLFLYDVTSSYLEGEKNELANWGYNRDKKKGKKQVVVGLLADVQGDPVAVRVFEGNTPDQKTVAEQVRTLAGNFGVKDVTLVGDRGMLKGPQIEALPEDFRYLTAITKPQIRKMLGEGVLQMELFSDNICEVEAEGIRYILRRNPVRAQQIAGTRHDKLESLQQYAKDQTDYLADHPQASAQKALKRVQARINKLKADKWLCATEKDRVINIDKDDGALAEVSLLDGCYVIKSNVPKDAANAQTLHDRYCDLENVERAFRTMKTTHLEMRPVYVRKETSTRGHVFVVMLALLLQRELERCWAELDITVKEGLDELGTISLQQIRLGNARLLNIPTPNKIGRQLLNKASIHLPSVLPLREARVHTKKKLKSHNVPL